MPVIAMPRTARENPPAPSTELFAGCAGAGHGTGPGTGPCTGPCTGSPFRGATRPAARRRGDASQGRALEALGHAVEYLVDSRLFTLDEDAAAADAEAAQLLMRLSCSVFAECPEVISLRRRARIWLVERFGSPLEASGAR